jgi:Mlc titration factor MtfA (ptsG expression regulator)
MSSVELRLIGLFAAAVACALAYFLYTSRRNRQRAAAFAVPFASEWRVLLERIPLYQRMPADLRRKLEPLIRQFLADIRFIGCDGLVINDEMRLTIATQACVLVASHGFEVLGDLHSVLVYPDEFVVEESDIDEAGVITEGSRAISGQTLDTDKIVLSWRDVQEAGTTHDGYNVVLHEFAHYLDHSVDGSLSATSTRPHASWHDVLNAEYQALCDAVDRGNETLIDPYGAEDPAEFFAVATETFFELPHALNTHHPALYTLLKDFYALDPEAWNDPVSRT